MTKRWLVITPPMETHMGWEAMHYEAEADARKRAEQLAKAYPGVEYYVAQIKTSVKFKVSDTPVWWPDDFPG